ncbi:MAG: cobalt transporter [Lachnospiraceae bacterium]|nr:cobalt transporter [Lachnospiraceae bacterium]
MIYEFGQELREVSIADIDENHLTAGYLSIEALKASYKTFGFSEYNLQECTTETVNFRSSMDVYENYSFGILNIINVNDVYGPRDRIGFFVKKNLFLIVDIRDADNSTKEIFRSAVERFQPDKMTLEKLIYGFFDRLLYTDSKGLEEKEFRIEEMEEEIHEGAIDRKYIGSILALKKEVTILRNYYEQLIEVGENLAEDENNLFPVDELRYFKMFTGKVERLSNNCQMLKENLVQVREAYSSSLDYSINSVMKLFTVVTTIFMPLTLITGWYGMNFTNMPELAWQYGYLFVVILSVTVVAVCFWVFKKKHLL